MRPRTSPVVRAGGVSTVVSTFSFETVRLADDREWFHAVANVVISLFGGLGAMSLGFAIGAVL